VKADRARAKGQPLVLLGVVLATWITGRIVLWESPVARAVPVLAAPMTALPASGEAPLVLTAAAAPARPGGVMTKVAPRCARCAVAVPNLGESFPFAAPAPAVNGLLPPPRLGDRAAPAHQMLLLAGLGYAGIAASAPPRTRLAGIYAAGTRPGVARPNTRWSGDAWLLLRGGSRPGSVAGGDAGYGGSQAGAVLRYSLAPGSDYLPQGYLRLSGSIGSPTGNDRELAAGIAVRPVPSLPVAILAEGRLQHSPTGSRLRPAVLAVSQLRPFPLPLGARGELYGAGGYVGGKGATPVFDVQFTAERPLADFGGKAAVEVGGGIWAGGQKGAARLDLGPRVSARVPLAGGGVRLSADWRFRIAGEAAPGSGPALTLSAGF